MHSTIENDMNNALPALQDSYESIVPKAAAEMKKYKWDDGVGKNLKSKVVYALENELRCTLIGDHLRTIVEFDLSDIFLAYEEAKEVLEGEK